VKKVPKVKPRIEKLNSRDHFLTKYTAVLRSTSSIPEDILKERECLYDTLVARMQSDNFFFCVFNAMIQTISSKPKAQNFFLNLVVFVVRERVALFYDSIL
jgi:hypothetical protein